MESDSFKSFVSSTEAAAIYVMEAILRGREPSTLDKILFSQGSEGHIESDHRLLIHWQFVEALVNANCYVESGRRGSFGAFKAKLRVQIVGMLCYKALPSARRGRKQAVY